MVLHELLVSLLATYASSEYLHGSRRRAIYAALAALAANVLLLLPAALAPLATPYKIIVVALCFLSALYVDTVKWHGQLSSLDFFAALQEAASRLIPLFPVLSIMLAFVFLQVGELCEHLLGMSDASISALLNQPIYYGVLYGPFSYVYVHVKAVAKASTLLPTRSV